MKVNVTKLVDLLEDVDQMDVINITSKELETLLNELNKAGMALVGLLNFIKNNEMA